MSKSTLTPPIFVRFLNAFFTRCGYLVADYDKYVLILTLLLTALLSSKILFTKQEDDIKTGYTPVGARSLDEIAAMSDFFAASGDPIAVFVFITAKDNGSMAEYSRMKEVVEVMDYLGTDLTHRNKSFFDICTDFCMVNEPVRQFYNGLSMKNHSLDDENSRFLLAFPTMEVMGKELDLSPCFFGVQTDENDVVEYVKIIMLQVRANSPEGWTKEDVAVYERMISTYFHKTYQSENLDIVAMSLTYTGDEIVRTGLTIFPFISVGFLIMAVFSVITVYYSTSQMGQWSSAKAILAVTGCVCPLLATSSALGLLFWCGVRFGTILCVTPFLTLAIGVDDAYLQIHAMLRLTCENSAMSKREKIARMLVEVGPSITITSMTNFFAFLVGIYTPTPEISLFCAGNSVAILFDFVYQITMYTAILSIYEKEESNDDHEVENKRKDSISVNNEKMDIFLDGYCSWVANIYTHVFLFIGLVIYLTVSIQGALSIRILLSPDKLVIGDSPMLKVNYLRDQYVAPNYTTVSIIVQKPGDMANASQLALVKNMVTEFERYPECLGRKFSHFFVRDYEYFLKDTKEEIEFEMEELESNETAVERPAAYSKAGMEDFLHWPEFHHWNGFVKFNNDDVIDRFWVTVSYHGDRLGDMDVRRQMLKRWRATADSYPSLNVSIFDDFAPFIDQLDTILPATISTSVCTLACMMIVCFLFMYNVFTVAVATAAITSICIGVLGMLSHWGVDLDPISMATTIMSIGFSVDFPAHITFHYFREGLIDPEATPAKRVARSLAAIGFPLLQCGVSTILFVLCLLFVPTYMSQVFVKTMILVVSLGLLHGLLVVPAFLCAFSSIYQVFFTEKIAPAQSLSSMAKLFQWRISPSGSVGKISA